MRHIIYTTYMWSPWKYVYLYMLNSKYIHYRRKEAIGLNTILFVIICARRTHSKTKKKQRDHKLRCDGHAYNGFGIGKGAWEGGKLNFSSYKICITVRIMYNIHYIHACSILGKDKNSMAKNYKNRTAQKCTEISIYEPIKDTIYIHI